MTIPVKADAATREGYTHNILDAYRRATEADRAKGAVWYSTANDLANLLGDGDVRKGAGVIAALSANKSWRENQRLAARAFSAQGLHKGHFADAIRKVDAIMMGEDPEDVLPMSSKTGHFFRCIADPTDPDPVVIDRHAHDIAIDEIYGDRERGLSSKGRYAVLAHCYREAALQLGIIPSVLQATTWVAHTRRLAGSRSRTMEHA